MCCRNGSTRFVEMDRLTVSAAALVEVATGHLEPPGIRDSACLQRLEASTADQALDRMHSTSSSVAWNRAARCGWRFAPLANAFA
jgi:hypothetical protein